MMASIFTDRVLDDVARRGVHLDRRHQRLVQLQVDRVELALARREPAVGREDARDVGLVVLVVGRVVELDEVAVLQRRRVLVVVRVVGVRAGGDEREVRRAVGAVLLEHELGVGLQLVLVHARPRVAHRFHDAEAGDARRLADDGDLPRALDGAQRVEDRIEILRAPTCGAAAFSFWTNCSSREMRPSHGSLFVAAPAPRDRSTTPRRGPRAGTACRSPVRRAVSSGSSFANSSRGSTASTPSDLRRVLARATGRAVHPLLAPLVVRLQEQRRLFRAPVDHRDRARLDDAGEVEELVVLPQRLLAGPLGRALQDRDAVADVRHQLRAPRRELLRREDLRAGEDGLGERDDGGGEERDGGEQWRSDHDGC